MPIYEYECPKCGVVEIMQSFSDKPLVKCPNCSKKVQKIISMSCFHLKGSGWYATDYGKGKGNGKSKPDKHESEAPKVASAEAPKNASTETKETTKSSPEASTPK